MVEAANLQEEDKWRHTREIIAMTYNTNVQKGKGKAGNKLIPLPSDNVVKVDKDGKVEPGISTKDFKKLVKRYGLKWPEKID